jgi:hypothetical protein
MLEDAFSSRGQLTPATPVRSETGHPYAGTWASGLPPARLRFCWEI